MLDWEEMVSNIADGALDMSGSRRRRKEKKSTKLRFTSRQSIITFKNQNLIISHMTILGLICDSP